MNNAAGNLKVTSINDDSILLQLSGKKVSGDFAHDAFPSSEGTVQHLEEFYVATQGDVVMRVASNVDADRSVVAALVGNWIASGFIVNNLNRKDLLKKLRIFTAKKDEIVDANSPVENDGQEFKGEIPIFDVVILKPTENPLPVAVNIEVEKPVPKRF